MELREHAGAAEFLASATELLGRDEARHNLIFGICATLTAAPDAFEAARFWTVEAGSAVVGAALVTPPYNLVVAKPHGPAVLAAAASGLHRRGLELPGVTGALPEADEFAAAWEELTGARRRARMRQGIYEAKSARQRDGVQGRMRLATAEDRELVLGWWRAFEDEAMSADAPRDQTEADIDRRLGSSTAGIALWEDGHPVAMTGFSGQAPHGTRIGPVYTPPELRRRGYAGALVAAVTERALERGGGFCFLYTDLANPSSNHIYREVGYSLVCESVDYAFAPRAAIAEL
jgi:GNAT superfamily N-acetyltransferase